MRNARRGIGFRSMVQNGYTSRRANRHARRTGHPAAAAAVLYVDRFHGRRAHLDGHRCGCPRLHRCSRRERDDERHEQGSGPISHQRMLAQRADTVDHPGLTYKYVRCGGIDRMQRLSHTRATTSGCVSAGCHSRIYLGPRGTVRRRNLPCEVGARYQRRRLLAAPVKSSSARRLIRRLLDLSPTSIVMVGEALFSRDIW